MNFTAIAPRRIYKGATGRLRVRGASARCGVRPNIAQLCTAERERERERERESVCVHPKGKPTFASTGAEIECLNNSQVDEFLCVCFEHSYSSAETQ